MGSRDGALKAAASRIGCDLQEYLTRVGAGEKWCGGCRAWHPLLAFSVDRSRSDGVSATCTEYRNRRARDGYESRATGAKPGPARAPARDGDKRQARAFVNRRVRDGSLPAPATLPCSDCGHLWRPGGKRHEYDHYLGYAAEHHGDVQPVCTTCHHARERVRQAAA